RFAQDVTPVSQVIHRQLRQTLTRSQEFVQLFLKFFRTVPIDREEPFTLYARVHSAPLYACVRTCKIQRRAAFVCSAALILIHLCSAPRPTSYPAKRSYPTPKQFAKTISFSEIASCQLIPPVENIVLFAAIGCCLD